jgi:hypothetical protein
MKRFRVDQESASLTCLCKKQYPMEMHGRSQGNGLRFETLGRNVMLTWSQLILQTPVAIAVTAAVDFRSRNWRRDNQTGTQLQYVATAYVIRREARDQTWQREERLWVTT